MERYDFIIAGAGSAGCVLADALTVSGRYKVLLIEAGGSDKRFAIQMPLGYGMTFKNPAVNWCYMAKSDPGLEGREGYWPRGRVIGGSSSINAMAYLQGQPHDFDDWEAAGATGWNWSSVKATYDKLETQECPDGTLNGSGPVHLHDAQERMHPFSARFLEAARQAGWPVREDLNGAQREGITRLKCTVKNGRRWSAADAFLRPAIKRHNLRVLSNTFIERIIVENDVAVGVECARAGDNLQFFANHEVIVSAGAVNSPKLLQLSGIGPAALLKQHGIDVKRDLPEVGKGLQDHLGISYQFACNIPTLNNRLGRWPGKISAGLQYVLMKRGPLSVPINQVSGFVRSRPENRADIQVYCNPMSYAVRSDGGPAVLPDAGFLLCAQPCRPTSRGEIKIASSDPLEAPAIHPNSLSTNEDCAMAIAACRTVQKLAETPAMKAVTTDGPDIAAMSDEDTLSDFRQRANSIYHASCTCRMGRSEKDSVTDARLRVHGVAGLRVIDASSFPNVTSGNTGAPVMMLAARGAEMILEDATRPIRMGGAA